MNRKEIRAKRMQVELEAVDAFLEQLTYPPRLTESEALHSIAISLKRIADRLEVITLVDCNADGSGQLNVGANCDVRQV
jgi:hypothetical protein